MTGHATRKMVVAAAAVAGITAAGAGALATMAPASVSPATTSVASGGDRIFGDFEDRDRVFPFFFERRDHDFRAFRDRDREHERRGLHGDRHGGPGPG